MTEILLTLVFLGSFHTALLGYKTALQIRTLTLKIKALEARLNGNHNN